MARSGSASRQVFRRLVEARWYHYLLFSHTATLLRLMLRFRGGPQVVVVDPPWYLRRSRRRFRRVRRDGSDIVPLAAQTAKV